MGVSRAQVAAVETGRKEFSEVPRHRLRVLVHYLPPPDGQGPPVPEGLPDLATADVATALAELGPLAPGPVQDRLRRLRFLALKARFELDQSQQPAQHHARRYWTIDVLRKALLPTNPDGTPAPSTLPAYFTHLQGALAPATDQVWLKRLALDTAATPAPLTAAGLVLQRGRLAGLDAEIAALEGYVPA
jgi:hypothetical protein